MQHNRYEGYRNGDHQTPSVSLLPCGEGETVVLQGPGSYQHVGQVLHNVPREVFPHGQNQCPTGENFKLPVEFNGVHPRGVGEATEYILAYPLHEMENWLILQNFYNGLTPMSRGHIDAAAGGAFLSLTINGATALIEKMVSNKWWGDERLQDEQQKGMHTMKEMDMLATKMDLLLRKLD